MKKVYFIRCKSTGLIKIGLSDNPWSRMTKIQADNPGELEMLAIEDGGSEREDALHKRFAGCHVRGEWHKPSSDLLNYISSHARPMPKRLEYLTLEGTKLNDRQLAKTLGLSFPLCAQMRSGVRAVPLSTAIRLHDITGERIGPLLNATPEEIGVLRKFVMAGPFHSNVTRAAVKAGNVVHIKPKAA